MAVSASIYDALYTSIGEQTGADIDEIEKALAHRTFPDDAFFAAWDEALRVGVALFRQVTEIEASVARDQARREKAVELASQRYANDDVEVIEDDEWPAVESVDGGYWVKTRVWIDADAVETTFERARCSCGRVAQDDGTCWLSASTCTLPKRKD